MAEMSWDGVLRRRIFITAVWTSVMTHGAVLIFCEGCHQNLLLLIKCCSRRTMYLEIKKKKIRLNGFQIKISLSKSCFPIPLGWELACEELCVTHAGEHTHQSGNGLSGGMRLLGLLMPSCTCCGLKWPHLALPSPSLPRPAGVPAVPEWSLMAPAPQAPVCVSQLPSPQQ
jgi:hypothetical protein